MEIIALGRVVSRRWWLLLALGTVGLVVGLVWGAATPRRYESAVTLQLNPAARSAFLQYNPDARNFDSVTALAASYIEVLRSRAFGESVVRELKLLVAPEAIAGSVSARLVPNTNILRLTVSWDNPGDAQALAQAIAEIFVTENLRRQQGQPGGQARLTEMEETARTYPSRIDALRQQRDRLDQAVARGDLSRLLELNGLETRLAALESSYTTLLVEINRARSSIDTASILDGATPARPAGAPSPAQAALFGLLAGLALGIAVAFLLNELDDRVRSAEDLTAANGGPPLAIVGRIGTAGWEPSARASHLATLYAPRSAEAEAFRTLRTYLRLVAAERPFRSLLVSSPGPAEGKTLVASNLAIAMAAAGKRVLLVDGDLRRPSLHEMFGLEEELGFVDALAQEAAHATLAGVPAAREPAIPGFHEGQRARSARDADAAVATAPDRIAGVVPGPVENLWILPAGEAADNPSDILGSPEVGPLLERLSAEWDLVIFDTAPIGPVADTLLLASHVDAALLVARSGQTRSRALRSALAAFGQAEYPLLGIVLNDFRVGPFARYLPYSQYYQYSRYQAKHSRERGNGHSSSTAGPAAVAPASALSVAAEVAVENGGSPGGIAPPIDPGVNRTVTVVRPVVEAPSLARAVQRIRTPSIVQRAAPAAVLLLMIVLTTVTLLALRNGSVLRAPDGDAAAPSTVAGVRENAERALTVDPPTTSAAPRVIVDDPLAAGSQPLLSTAEVPPGTAEGPLGREPVPTESVGISSATEREPEVRRTVVRAPQGFASVVLRAEPSTRGQNLATLLNGTPLEVLQGTATGDGFTWVRVRTTDGTTGWVVSTSVP